MNLKTIAINTFFFFQQIVKLKQFIVHELRVSVKNQIHYKVNESGKNRISAICTSMHFYMTNDYFILTIIKKF